MRSIAALSKAFTTRRIGALFAAAISRCIWLLVAELAIGKPPGGPGVAALGLEPGSVDAVVACGVLCSVSDQSAALAEFRRVLRPGGELRFYEHVRSRRPGFARWQHRVDPLWTRMFGGEYSTAFSISSASRWVRSATAVPATRSSDSATRSTRT